MEWYVLQAVTQFELAHMMVMMITVEGMGPQFTFFADANPFFALTREPTNQP